MENQSGWSNNLTRFHEDTSGLSHFIDLASRAHCLEELRHWLTPITRPSIMDIGCSSGFMIHDLRASFPGASVMGSDIVFDALERLARENKNLPLLLFNLVHCPLSDEWLDGVTLLNVLEHINDDREALKQVFRILKPGGVAVIEVPAGPALFDSYDRMLMHQRRYVLNDLEKMTTEIGFQTLNRSHLGVFFYPGFWLVKKKNRLIDASRSSQHGKDNSFDDEVIVKKEILTTGGSLILQKLMNMELALGKYISYPFGIRCLLTLKKM